MSKEIYGIATDDCDYEYRRREVYVDSTGKRCERTLWLCPYHSRWRDLIRRCYSKYCLDRVGVYKGCTVCSDWLVFSNFKAWMESQNWEGHQLDKDLLIKDNKIYSLDTCIFLHKKVNIFMSGGHRKKQSNNLLGVFTLRDCHTFGSQCNNPFKTSKADRGYLGMFPTELQAHQAWQAQKHTYACQLAASEYVTDERVAKALRERYAVGTIHL